MIIIVFGSENIWAQNQKKIQFYTGIVGNPRVKEPFQKYGQWAYKADIGMKLGKHFAFGFQPYYIDVISFRYARDRVHLSNLDILTRGLGTDFYLRFLVDIKKVRLYTEGGIGRATTKLLWFLDGEVHRWNKEYENSNSLDLFGGVGAEYFIKEKIALDLKCHYWIMINDWTSGSINGFNVDRNIQQFVGLLGVKYYFSSQRSEKRVEGSKKK